MASLRGKSVAKGKKFLVNSSKIWISMCFFFAISRIFPKASGMDPPLQVQCIFCEGERQLPSLSGSFRCLAFHRPQLSCLVDRMSWGGGKDALRCPQVPPGWLLRPGPPRPRPEVAGGPLPLRRARALCGVRGRGPRTTTAAAVIIFATLAGCCPTAFPAACPPASTLLDGGKPSPRKDMRRADSCIHGHQGALFGCTSAFAAPWARPVVWHTPRTVVDTIPQRFQPASAFFPTQHLPVGLRTPRWIH